MDNGFISFAFERTILSENKVVKKIMGETLAIM